MKVAVIGTCQVRTIAACMRILMPGSEIEDVWVAPSRAEQQARVWKTINEYDAVVMQPVASPLTVAELNQQAKLLLWIPPVAFNGSQPDDVIIASLVGALGANHSAIAVSSFLLGLPEERCRKLFNAFIYASLGYFERFEIEKQRLLAQARKWDIVLDDHFGRWTPDFMYDIYHPRLAPLASIAEVLAIRLTGRAAPEDGWWTSVESDFGEKTFHIWPVYPEIAERLGAPAQEIRFSVSTASEPGIDLAQFIERSYAVYRKADKKVLQNVVAREMAIMAELLGLALPAEAA